ncbi:MAG TPA: response regulator [Pirellulales bacterium]|nr:response regulator [Pirellulales bacterium]HXT59841.1 response regulator [Pirellulales bacterium]
MMVSTHYIQQCPTCGRSLRVRVEYLGRQVACMHCHGRFLAYDPESPRASLSDSGLDLLRRADELLNRAEERAL